MNARAEVAAHLNPGEQAHTVLELTQLPGDDGEVPVYVGLSDVRMVIVMKRRADRSTFAVDLEHIIETMSTSGRTSLLHLRTTTGNVITFTNVPPKAAATIQSAIAFAKRERGART